MPDEMHLMLGQIDGKLDMLIQQSGIQDDRIQKNSDRIGKVETKQAWYAGAGSMIGLIIGSIFKGHIGDWNS